MSSIIKRIVAFLEQINPKVIAHFVTSALTFAVLKAGIGVDPVVATYISLAAGAITAWFVKAEQHIAPAKPAARTRRAPR